MFFQKELAWMLVFCVLAACVKPSNTQITPDFIERTQDKTPQQLAAMLYRQTHAKYHNRMIDRCTQMQVKQEQSKVIFEHLLLEKKCNNAVRKMNAAQVKQYLHKAKQFRMNQIQKVPTAKMILNGGVVQVYRYYLMPGRKPVGEFQIDKNDIR